MRFVIYLIYINLIVVSWHIKTGGAENFQKLLLQSTSIKQAPNYPNKHFSCTTLQINWKNVTLELCQKQNSFQSFLSIRYVSKSYATLGYEIYLIRFSLLKPSLLSSNYNKSRMLSWIAVIQVLSIIFLKLNSWRHLDFPHIS